MSYIPDRFPIITYRPADRDRLASITLISGDRSPHFMHTVAQMLMGDHRVEVVRHLVPNPYALTIEARDSLLDSFITNPTDAVVIEARTTGGDGMVEHLRGLGRSAILWTMDEGQDQARIPRVEWVTRALALAQELADIALDPPQMR